MSATQCYDCPRMCGADRKTETGYCGIGYNAVIAKTIVPFELEEPCLGKLSAVFFSGCNLGCSYCQNHKISRGRTGAEVSDAELAEIFDSAVGAIDLVTPTHSISAIERAVIRTKKRLKYIYNTSGYETTEGVRRAAEFSDVFLTDFKYVDGRISDKYSAAPDYFDVASKAVKEMRKIKDETEVENGEKVLKRGLVVRHLVLPGHVADSIAVIDFIAAELGTDTVISLMSQFTPNGVGEPSVGLKRLEYKLVAEHALKKGFKNGYFQGYESADSAYTPDFDIHCR